jgi:RNA polymerase sigma-70 factor, ECF subfamily
MVKGPPHTDLDVARRILDGDEPTFSAMVTRHHRAMIGVARTFVKDDASAEEVVQDTWVAFLDALPRFEGRASLRTFLFRILANRARTRAVRDSRQVPFSSIDETGDFVDAARFDSTGHWIRAPRPWEWDTPEAMVSNKEVLRWFEEALKELPERQRAVLLLRDVEDLDSAEVCEVLEVSEGNQRVLLHRARAAIRTFVDDKTRGRR